MLPYLKKFIQERNKQRKVWRNKRKKGQETRTIVEEKEKMDRNY